MEMKQQCMWETKRTVNGIVKKNKEAYSFYTERPYILDEGGLFLRNILKSTLLIIALLAVYGCKSETVDSNPVKFQGLNTGEVEISASIQEGFPVGAEFDRDEVYVCSAQQAKRNFLISIIDLKTGGIKKSVPLPAGDYQSPTEYFSPVQIQFIDSRYYVVDQFEKIVVYDADFNHLYSSMYNQLRFFIDIFTYDDNAFFLVSTREISMKTRSRLYLYRLLDNRKPVEETQLPHQFELPSVAIKNTKNTYYTGYFWPTVNGFEKDGVVYYGIGNTKEIYAYNLKEKKESVHSLSYLEPKTFTDDDAQRLGYYNTDGYEERTFKKTGLKIIYTSYPDKMYHFGLYDLGANKIGIAADVNLDNMTIRIDVIDTTLWEYRESIWFPIDYGFKVSLSSSYRGLNKSHINIDKGVSVHMDLEGEGFDPVAKIDRFNIK